MAKYADERGSQPTTMEAWEKNLELLRFALKERPKYAWQHLQEELKLGNFTSISVNNPNLEQGSVTVNGIAIDSTNWLGRYFAGCIINVAAVPKPGYRFSHWQSSGKTTAKMRVKATAGAQRFTPVFERD